MLAGSPDRHGYFGLIVKLTSLRAHQFCFECRWFKVMLCCAGYAGAIRLKRGNFRAHSARSYPGEKPQSS